MVSEIRVFLVMSLAIDVKLMEKVEGGSDTGKREAQFEQYEEEQRDQDGRYECEDYFLDGTASSFTQLWSDSNGR